MTYQYGTTFKKPNGLTLTQDELRAKIEKLRKLEAAIEAEAIAKEQHLSRLYAERRRRHRLGDYTPSPEALAYRDEHAATIAAQPAPLHGGRRGLAAATREAMEHDARKRENAA